MASAQNLEKLKKHYDVVFVGDTLAARSMALSAIEVGYNVCILSQSPLAPEPFLSLGSEQLLPNSHLVNSPSNSEEASVQLANQAIAVRTYDGPPLMCHKGELKSFRGFDSSAKIVESKELAPFLMATSFSESSLVEITNLLVEKTEDIVFRQKTVTACHWNDQLLESLEINGQDTLKGGHFFFAHQFPWILKEMANHEKGLASFLKKLQWFSSLEITFIHNGDLSQAQAPKEPFLLYGSKNKPCLGGFYTGLSGFDGPVSRWQALIPSELDQDSENIGQVVKEIKKQVKRAFPKLWSQPPKEYITFWPCQRAQLVGVEKYASKFKNLHLATPLVGGKIGPLHELQMGPLFDWDLLSTKDTLPKDEPSQEAPSSQ